MTAGWQTKRLGDVCEYDRRLADNGSLPYLGMEQIEAGTGRIIGDLAPAETESSSFEFSAEHVLYGRLRPYLNKVALPQVSGRCSTEIFPLKPVPSVSREFLFYWFIRPETVSAIDRTSTGARMPRANMNAVAEMPFSYPPLAEQKRIVTILDEAFEWIAKATANAERNLANARELFSSTLDQRFILAPDHWHRRSLGEVCSFSGGSQPPKSEFSKVLKPGYVRLIQIRDYKSDKYITFVDEKAVSKFCDSSDVMIGRYGPPLFQILRGIEGAYNVALMKATPDVEVLLKDYLYYFLKNTQILNHIIKHSDRAAGQTGIKREVLEAYEICFPERREQADVVRELGELEQLCRNLTDAYEVKLSQLSKVKQALLHKAYSGQLTGREAIAA